MSDNIMCAIIYSLAGFVITLIVCQAVELIRHNTQVFINSWLQEWRDGKFK